MGCTWSHIRSHFFSLSYCLRSLALSGGRFMEFWKTRYEEIIRLIFCIVNSIFNSVWPKAQIVCLSRPKTCPKHSAVVLWPQFLCWCQTSCCLWSSTSSRLCFWNIQETQSFSRQRRYQRERHKPSFGNPSKHLRLQQPKGCCFTEIHHKCCNLCLGTAHLMILRLWSH